MSFANSELTPCADPSPVHSRPQVLRLQYQKELAQSHVTVQTKFNYAWGLVKSPLREHQVEGVRLLQGASNYPYHTSMQQPPKLECATVYRDLPGGGGKA